MVGLASLFDAVARMQAGDPDRAADACRTALETWHGHRYDVQILEALDVLAWASAAGGQAETAGRLLAVTTERGASAGGPPPPTRTSGRHRRASAVTDADAFRAGERSAAELTVDDAVAMVTRSRGPRLRPLVGWPSLTPTEQAVVALVAEGLSNPDIAERLFISRSTVKTHLNHVFTKLDIANPPSWRPPTPARSRGDARPGAADCSSSDPEDLGLLRRELLVGEDPLGMELRELGQLVSRVGRGRWGRGGGAYSWGGAAAASASWPAHFFC